MTALDITPFLEAKSDQITADDMIAGPRSFRVARVEMPGGEQPVSIHMEGMEGKPFKPCKGMRRLLAQMWGPDAAKWSGRSITLFRDPDVRFGADQTGGVRVAAVSHIEEPNRVAVRVSRGKLKEYNIAPMPTQPATDPAQKWATAFIATVNETGDIPALENFAASKADKLAEMGEKRPELHEQCVGALNSRRQALAPSASDSEFGDGSDARKQFRIAEIRAGIKQSASLDYLDTLQDAFADQAADFPSDVADELRQAFTARRSDIEADA